MALALTEAKKMIKEKFCSEVPEDQKQYFLDVLLKFHEATSEDQFNLGQCRTDLHKTTLKTNEPIFMKQFKILDAHMEEVEGTSWNGSNLESLNRPKASTIA